jgi:hypothetical protein
MVCPHCLEDLIITERQGIEIDYCAKCRGVWLDRGELDKIIERTVQTMNPQNYQAPPPTQGHMHHQDPYYGKKKKKKAYKSVLEEIFDF